MSKNLTALNVSFLCQKFGISPRQLAINTNLSPSAIYRLVDTSNQITPRARTVFTVANYFKVDPRALTTQDLTACPDIDSCQNVTKNSETLVIEPNSAPNPCPENACEDTPSTSNIHNADLVPLIAIDNPARFNPENYFSFLDDYVNDEETQKLCGFAVKAWIPLPYGLEGKNVTAYRAVGDAMSPGINDGDIVYVSDFDKAVFESQAPAIGSGNLVLAKGTLGGKPAIVIRKVLKNENNEIFLVAENPHMPGQAIKADAVYGRVLGISRGL